MKNIYLLLAVLFSTSIYAQDCDCKSTFDWVKRTFEENDAGFQYILDDKGDQAYSLHNQIFDQKLKGAGSLTECNEIINEWLKFFRDGHIGLQFLGQPENISDTSPSEDQQDERTDQWETYSTDLNTFKEYLDNKEGDNMEGIWETGPYQMAIKKETGKYIGFITESKVEEWKKGEVKLEIFTDGDKPRSVFYMFDRSTQESDVVSLLSPNNLQLGDIYLKRTYPEIEDNSPMDLYIRTMESPLPFLERLNSSTLYFRIPSFSGTPEKTAIDSVIAANRDQILSTENLIIDIRNGTGGSDQSYSEIIPLLYTNPVRMPAVEYRSTPLNNQRMLDFSRNEGLAVDFNITFDEEQKAEFKRYYEILSQNEGEFVNLGSSDVSVTKNDTIYAFPKNVAIIHNQNNGSTDEQFLLEARQSRKVKLFGTPTHGILDVSNMNRAMSPCGDFALWYALTKSLRVPEMAIDGVGVQPDYYIDSEIPDYDWIQYVVEILNE